MRFTLFHTEYGTLSGPRAEVGEDSDRASLISSMERETAQGSWVR